MENATKSPIISASPSLSSAVPKTFRSITSSLVIRRKFSSPKFLLKISGKLSIYSSFTGKDFEAIEKEFDGKGYGDFKAAVGEVCADGLAPIREEYARLVKDKAYLEDVMKKGSDTAAYLARKTLSKVYRKVGFYSVK